MKNVMLLKEKLIVMVVVIFAILGAVYLYMHLPMFGRLPQGDRLARMQKMPNYRDGQFHNLHATPVLVKKGLASTWFGFLFRNNKNLKPPKALPSIKTDLKKLDSKEDVMVWFGHSSYFLQINGKRILIDPLFSEVSSPVLFFPKAFDGTCIYQTDDIPELDYLIITHDHWDHLDYQTIRKLRKKVKKVICPLGVGETLEHWKFDKNQIIEMYWGDSQSLNNELVLYCLPSRHFSGRGFLRNKTLWASFLIQSKDLKLYFSGDSGYDDHFQKIQEKFGAIDFAMLDSGQHDESWKYIHMLTPDVIRAAQDLKTKILIPAHICKLSLAYHPWNEPMEELVELSKDKNLKLFIPMIGEKINLHAKEFPLKTWWRDVK